MIKSGNFSFPVKQIAMKHQFRVLQYLQYECHFFLILQ